MTVPFLSSSASARKILISKPGGYDRLQMVEAEVKPPDSDQVQIKVRFTGVNYADILVRWGVYESARKLVGWPITPGFEVSGVVQAVGNLVKNFKVGDEVVGFTLFNGYSSVINIPENQVIFLPPGFSLAQGAGFPAVYMTAYYALLQICVLPPRAKLLIHSAAGGVGTALIQVCRAMGYDAIGIVGASSKTEYVKSIGGKKVYDKSSKDFRWSQIKRDFPEGFDAVLDANGYTTLRASYDLLRPTGKLVIYGSHSLFPKTGGRVDWLKAAAGLLKTPRYNPLKLISDNKSLICFNVSFLFPEKRLVQENLEGLQTFIKKGLIQPPTVKVFRFEDVAKAHAHLESGMSVGKIVLEHSV